MRRFTLVSAAAAVALTIAIPMGTTAQAGDDTVVGRRPDRELLRLECAAHATDAGPAVACSWSGPTVRSAVRVRLLRFDRTTDAHRMVVFRTGDLEVTSFTDRNLRPGHDYTYAVQALDPRGRVVGMSRPETVSVPDPVEVLRLGCELVPAAIECEWSTPQSRDAYVVTLWRSVDGGARHVVHRFRPTGPNAYRDPVPAGASRVTYAVIATSDSDRIVARSRAEMVVVPDIRRVDVAPSGERVAP